MIYTVKRFGIVNKAEMDVFLELSCFFDDPVDVGNLISAFSKTSLNIQKTIMASGPITSWQIDGETVDTVSDFILGGSKITAYGIVTQLEPDILECLYHHRLQMVIAVLKLKNAYSLEGKL